MPWKWWKRTKEDYEIEQRDLQRIFIQPNIAAPKHPIDEITDSIRNAARNGRFGLASDLCDILKKEVERLEKEPPFKASDFIKDVTKVVGPKPVKKTLEKMH